MTVSCCLKGWSTSTTRDSTKKLAEAEKVLAECLTRLDKVDMLIRKLFEEKCLGNMPDSIFKKLILNYEREKEILNGDVDRAKQVILKLWNQAKNTSACLERLKGYMNIESLDRKIVTDLIDSIDVFEAKKIGGVKQQTITVHYRLTGIYRLRG